MRILILVEHLHGKSLIGGYRKLLDNLHHWSTKRDVKIDVAEFLDGTCKPLKERFKIDYNLYPIYHLKLPFAHLTMYIDSVISFIKVLSLLIKNRYDAAVTSETGKIPDIVCYLLSKFSRVHTLMYFNHAENVFRNVREAYQYYRYKMGYHPIASFLSSLDYKLIVQAFKSADMIITLSNFSLKQLTTMGLKKEKILVTGAGIDVDKFVRTERITKKYEGIFVGRLAPEKGIFDLVKIWSGVVKKNPTASLLIIGTGSESPYIEKLGNMIRQYELNENVIFLDSFSDVTLIEFLKSSKVFVFPSHLEGWGLAVAEAMATGLPVVTSDIEPLNELFNSGGVLFARDINSFIKNILFLLQNDLLSEKMGEINAEYVKRYDYRRIAQIELKAIRRMKNE